MKFKIYSKASEQSHFVKKQLMEKLNWQYQVVKPKIIVVIGGDGAFLSAVQEYGNTVEYIMISIGNVGFYKTMTFHEFSANPRTIKNFIKKDHLAKINIISTKINKNSLHALNEIRFVSLEQPLKSNIYVNKQLIGNFCGSEIYISSPTGSTAYNLANGGPILTSLNNFILGFNAKNRLIDSSLHNPIVFNNGDEIAIELSSQNIHLILDNKDYRKPISAGKFIITYGAVQIGLYKESLINNNYNWFKIVN